VANGEKEIPGEGEAAAGKSADGLLVKRAAAVSSLSRSEHSTRGPDTNHRLQNPLAVFGGGKNQEGGHFGRSSSVNGCAREVAAAGGYETKAARWEAS